MRLTSLGFVVSDVGATAMGGMDMFSAALKGGGGHSLLIIF